MRVVTRGAVAGLLASALLVSASAGAATSATYVALGDSYSSGAGLGPFFAGPAGCDRSPESFPAIVSRARHLRLDFVACAGATVNQIDAQVAAAGPSLRRANVVTLTAGGNDLSFSDLLVSCLGGVATTTAATVQYFSYASGPTACASAVATAASLLGASVSVTGALRVSPAVANARVAAASPLEHRLTGLLRATLAASPLGNDGRGARVLVVNYPMLLSGAGAPTCLVGASPISVGTTTGFYPAFAGPAARQLIAINHLLRVETSTAVARFTMSPSRLRVVSAPGFEPLNCATGSSSDLNGLSAASLQSGGSFHPTALGQRVLASAVRTALTP